MKVCSRCGETYKEHIDFCFVDGDVLVKAPDAMDVPEPGNTGVPVAPVAQGRQEPVDEHPRVVPVDPPDPDEAMHTTEVPAPRPRKHGTLVPGLGSEELEDEIEEAAASSGNSQIPTDVPLAPPSPVPTLPPGPSRPEPLERSPVPPPPVAQGSQGAQDNRILFLGVFGVFLLLVLVGGATATIWFGLAGRGEETTVVEPRIDPKVVPPTPTEGSDEGAAPDAAPVAEPDGAGEGTEVPPVEEDPAEGTPEPQVEAAVAPEAPPEPAPVAPAPAPVEAPAPAPVAPVPAPVAPAPAPVAPAPAPVAAPAPEPAGEAGVWGGGETAPAPAPAAATAKGPVMIFFAGRVGDALAIDGQAAGVLPAKATLSSGSHTFVVSGAAGKVTVKQDVKLNEDGTVTILQLSAN